METVWQVLTWLGWLWTTSDRLYDWLYYHAFLFGFVAFVLYAVGTGIVAAWRWHSRRLPGQP